MVALFSTFYFYKFCFVGGYLGNSSKLARFVVENFLIYLMFGHILPPMQERSSLFLFCENLQTGKFVSYNSYNFSPFKRWEPWLGSYETKHAEASAAALAQRYNTSIMIMRSWVHE